MTLSASSSIHKLSDTGNTITPATDDIRGRSVTDKDGEPIGRVHDLLIDDEEQRVRFLLVEHSGFLGFGHTTSFIPVDAITRISEHEVAIDHDREHVAAAPPYDPALIADSTYHGRVYRHYGYNAFWDDGYVYPANLPAMLAPH
ncbi:PRC-barrel domain-containing protein [Nocardioides halotolerans]|jgi:sporulation protein YlmC with PRC-barrel domain|uniref:PRC-barrel domain-containing protein n=1 Tax=Nocardioides halotolerans TaxID=433660 RepID=UPI00040278F6|nr:PRC-barrel domain-containing protein [Nocardioides halotolerans]